MTKKELIYAALAFACTSAMHSATASDSLMQLDNNMLDAITGAGPSVQVSITAGGSGNSNSYTSIRGNSTSNHNYPVVVIYATGSAIACCGDVYTTAEASTTITNPGRFPFQTSLQSTISALGISVSVGTAIAINAL